RRFQIGHKLHFSHRSLYFVKERQSNPDNRDYKKSQAINVWLFCVWGKGNGTAKLCSFPKHLTPFPFLLKNM
ncbi:hypothetical protein CH370_16735, partial [Leptospira kmetyi]